MLTDYLNEALERAKYEMIEDQEPYYGEIAETPVYGLQARRLRNAGGIWQPL